MLRTTTPPPQSQSPPQVESSKSRPHTRPRKRRRRQSRSAAAIAARKNGTSVPRNEHAEVQLTPAPGVVGDTLRCPQRLRNAILPYLPKHESSGPLGLEEPVSKPHVTLTYATSLDSAISIAPSRSTVLSGSASKAMTHFLRSAHDAILVGSGTAATDDPTLNSRSDVAAVSGLEHQPQPVVLDRRGRWDVSESSKLIKAAMEGRGKPPWIFVAAPNIPLMPQVRRDVVRRCGGEFIPCTSDIVSLLPVLAQRGIRSVMIEGGGSIINDLLTNHADVIDTVIITIAPIYLGWGGVYICPENKTEVGKEKLPAVKFRDVSWLHAEKDIVMCACIRKD